MRPLRTLLLGASVALAACVGSIGDRSDQPDPPADDGPPAPATTDEPLCKEHTVGDTPVRRLSRVEYDRTVEILLGDSTRPARDFPQDEGAAVGLQVSALHVNVFLTAAETLAANAVRDRFATLFPCDGAEAACARTFIERFGARAYRRPLEAPEKTRLFELFVATRAKVDLVNAVRVVVEAMLMSPQFLYRIELTPPVAGQTMVRIDSYEMASRLSFFLWKSMPDDALFELAARNELATPEQVAAQARRMIADPKDAKAIDPRAREAIEDLFVRWFGLDQLEGVVKSVNAFPLFDDKLLTSMRGETRAFLDEVMWRGDARLETLLTAPFTYVDASLAKVYGIAAPAAPGFTRVALDPKTRAGILTQPGILAMLAAADQTHPVLRGKFIRERLLCQELPDPPAELMPMVPEPKPGANARERWGAHSSDKACAGCHRLMDPVGLGFEHYDGLGSFRALDQGKPIDARGELIDAEDASGAFDGVPDLARKLAKSKIVQRCVSQHWFRLIFDRDGHRADGCSLVALDEAFAKSGGNFRELLIAITTTDAFLNRPSSR